MATTVRPVVMPYTFKTAKVIVTRDAAPDAPDDFTDHVGEVTLTPTVESGSWRGVGGNVIKDTGVPEWVAQLGLIQDLDANGFLRYLLEHSGEKATIEATPATGADPITVDVTLAPATIGGQPGANPLSSTVSLPVDGQPDWS